MKEDDEVKEILKNEVHYDDADDEEEEEEEEYDPDSIENYQQQYI